jgi:hypothetical protein
VPCARRSNESLPLSSRASPELPATPAARRAELLSQFANELERVNGHFMGVVSPGEVCQKIEALTREMRPRSVAVGEAVALDVAPIIKGLDLSAIELVRCGKSNDDERLALRERLARCDLYFPSNRANSSTVMSTVRRMLLRVPRSSVSCSGTVTAWRPSQTNRTWLPFWRASVYPSFANARMQSRPEII